MPAGPIKFTIFTPDGSCRRANRRPAYRCHLHELHTGSTIRQDGLALPAATAEFTNFTPARGRCRGVLRHLRGRQVHELHTVKMSMPGGPTMRTGSINFTNFTPKGGRCRARRGARAGYVQELHTGECLVTRSADLSGCKRTRDLRSGGADHGDGLAWRSPVGQPHHRSRPPRRLTSAVPERSAKRGETIPRTPFPILAFPATLPAT